jgi:hypothetical protein
MKLSDLVTSRADGSLSLTKLAASTAHFLFACAFAKLQLLDPSATFDVTLWATYGGFAIAHATYDKTMAVVKDLKDRQHEALSSDPRPAVSPRSPGV